MRILRRGGWLLITALAVSHSSADLAIAQVKSSNFLTPDSQTAPFEGWSRGDAGAYYAAWEVFTTELGPNEHMLEEVDPDDMSPGVELPADPIFPSVEVATVTETGAFNLIDGFNGNGAFITSSDNIYSFTAPTDFEVVFPGEDAGAGFSTRFVAQLGTLGSLADPTSFMLTYEDENDAEVSIAPGMTQELRNGTISGTFGGTLQETLIVWDVAGFNPDEFIFTFNSLTSSMSLDYLVIDVFTFADTTPGDYSGDGQVDGADYLLWRSQFGTAGPDADGNGDGIVNAADYTVWRDNYSPAPPQTGSGAVSAAPEPSPLQMLSLVGLSVAFCTWVARLGLSDSQQPPKF